MFPLAYSLLTASALNCWTKLRCLHSAHSLVWHVLCRFIVVGCKSDLRDDEKAIAAMKKKGESPITNDEGARACMLALLFASFLHARSLCSVLLSDLLPCDFVNAGHALARELGAQRYTECSASTQTGATPCVCCFLLLRHVVQLMRCNVRSGLKNVMQDACTVGLQTKKNSSVCTIL